MMVLVYKTAGKSVGGGWRRKEVKSSDGYQVWQHGVSP